eukprot:TRINITY_DN7567_c0_g1_i3.p1 TRINITY_DN7567_c0_g1~~TRINITY_DN7567_c0_g1_i3.p1  ORF type:complete len:369 (-),score=69.01 TRINITY_DN7567_c0_g1_i3:281-1387(-)
MSDAQFSRVWAALRPKEGMVWYRHFLAHYSIHASPKLTKQIKLADSKASSERRQHRPRPAPTPPRMPAHLLMGQPPASSPRRTMPAPGAPKHKIAGDYRWDARWDQTRCVCSQAAACCVACAACCACVCAERRSPHTGGSVGGARLEEAAAIEALAAHMNKWATAQAAFRSIDVDGSGILEPVELAAAFQRLNLAIKPHVASRIARRLGALRPGGGIDYQAFKKHFGEEFGMAHSTNVQAGNLPRPPKLRAHTPGVMSLEAAEAVLLRKLAAHSGELHRAFQELDIDGSGQLDTDEFRRVLHNLNIKVSGENLAKLVKKFDIDRSGGVDYAEFCRKLRTNTPSQGLFRWEGAHGGHFSQRVRGKRVHN